MKNKASAFLKHIVSVLSSIVKAKTVGIRSKTNAAKARLIMLSLMKNKKVLVDSLSHKIQSVLGQRDKGSEDYLDVSGEQSKAIVLYEGSYNEESSEVGYCNDEGDDDDKYPDLRHSLFNEEELDLDEDHLQGGCGSIIDMMRNSKEEEGHNFSLEDEIDHVADLFITKFHKQIRMQKLHSFKRFQEMMARSV